MQMQNCDLLKLFILIKLFSTALMFSKSTKCVDEYGEYFYLIKMCKTCEFELLELLKRILAWTQETKQDRI